LEHAALDDELRADGIQRRDEERREVEAVVAPFKNLALGVFLLTVGMQLDLRFLIAEWSALLGAVACVVAGVAPAKEVFRPFADPLIFLFIGSSLLAEAIRQHRLDRRLAYGVLSLPAVGERPVGILAAVVAVSVLISAFISNTVTAAMMMAIVTGILAAIEESATVSGVRPAARFATGLFLSIAFAASIGGLATPIGTPTNLIGLGFIRNQLGVSISFPGWCAISLPVVAILATILVMVMSRLFPAGVDRLEGVQEFVRGERARLGRWTTGQKSTALAFGATVAMWVVPGVLLVVLGADHPASVWLRDNCRCPSCLHATT
jgi:sodium-dependent dicarboxylate transporter 2/3/5